MQIFYLRFLNNKNKNKNNICGMADTSLRLHSLNRFTFCNLLLLKLKSTFHIQIQISKKALLGSLGPESKVRRICLTNKGFAGSRGDKAAFIAKVI
jgi:hypothetical protein